VTITDLSRRADRRGGQVVLALKGAFIHISYMAKAAAPKTTKRTRNVAVGKTSDGVVILMPAIPPRSFTYREIKKTIDSVKDRARHAEQEPAQQDDGGIRPKRTAQQ
jgi:hypothetical protein